MTPGGVFPLADVADASEKGAGGQDDFRAGDLGVGAGFYSNDFRGF